MAQQLVDAMAGDFNAAAYRDEYRDALLNIIEAKADGAEIAQSVPPPAGKVTDLMAALEASVAAAKAVRDAAAPQTMAEAKARPARKTAPKPPAEEEIGAAAPVRRRKTA
jgi:DNA end-binding protein Ku